MNRLTKISVDIENLRQEMYKLIEQEKYMITPKVVAISQKLDELIVEYNNIKYKY